MTTPVLSPSRPRVRRSAKVLGAVAIAVLGFSACTSVPSPKRVAKDIINTAVVEGELTQAEGDCMIERLDKYGKDELKDITKSADTAGPGTAIEMFEADLAACKTG